MKRETNRLRVLRAERRLTQFALARKARVNVTRLSYLENGLVDAKADESERLARALKVPVHDIFPAQTAVTS